MMLKGQMDEKQKIRQQVKEKRDAMTAADVEMKSSAIAEKLAKMKEYSMAKTVLFYAAQGKEVRTKKLIGAALKSGKIVLLPITNTATKELELAEINDYEKDLKQGAFGIMEPKRKKPVEEDTIEVVIVPSVAFNRQGHRLGYGLGYYDKLLNRLTKKRPALCKIGLAYDFQVVKALPAEEHDQRMGVIITESRILRHQRRGSGGNA